MGMFEEVETPGYKIGHGEIVEDIIAPHGRIVPKTS